MDVALFIASWKEILIGLWGPGNGAPRFDGKRYIFFKGQAVRCIAPCFLERRKRVRGLGEGGSGVFPEFGLADDGKR